MPNTIEKLEYFVAGFCENKIQHLFKQHQKETVYFPAGVFLIQHREKGYFLYDTGYDDEIVSGRLKYLLYRLPNPIHMRPKDTIDAQLKQRGISPDEIKTVFVSHLHPDHIGRLRAFQQARFILTRDCYETYRHSSVKDLVFREYFPDDFDRRLDILDFDQALPVLETESACDVLGDGSMWAFSLDGHAKGQLCLWLPERKVVIAADALWHTEWLDKIPYMKWVPRFIQDNMKDYQASSRILKTLLDQGLKVVVSHDPAERVREVIDA